MSQSLVIGGSYPARRSSGISVKESTKGALMVHVPYKLTGDLAFEAIQSICIGTKDGALQERAIDNLHRIFPGWESQNPFDLQRLEIEEGNEPEFMLVNWHNEPYTPEGKTEQVDKFLFQWINELGRGATQADEDEEKATLAKWGVKFGIGKLATAGKKSTPAKPAAEKSAAKPTPGKKAKPEKVWTDATVWIALLEKNGITIVKDADGDPAADPETPEAKLDPIVAAYYQGQNDALGYDSTSDKEISGEQWGEVAIKLEL